MTFIAENYVPRETGPTCLTETPNNLSICIRCSGSLVSWGERTTKQNEGVSPGVPEQDKPSNDDGTGDTGGDVNIDKDEVDRLVKETKAKAEAQTDDDVDMTGPQPSQAGTAGNGRSARPTPEPKTTVEGKGKDQQEAEDERQAEEEDQVPVWATRMVPVHHSLVDAAENEVAVDSTARIIDNMILTRIKDRYRLYYLYMVTTPSQSYVEYGKNNGMIPEYDAYTSPTLGRTRTATSGSPRRKSTRRHLNDIANGEYLAAATLTSIPGVLKVSSSCASS